MLLKGRADSDDVEQTKIGTVKKLDNSKDVLIGQLNRVLYVRFILGTASTGRISRYTIIFAEPFELRVKDRFVTAGFGDGAFKVVWNDSMRNATIVSHKL